LVVWRLVCNAVRRPWTTGDSYVVDRKEAKMAVARAVTFSGVDRQHMADLAKQIESDPRPDDIPATEILMLHDEAANSSLVILFFENEDDYAKGDAALNAMPTGDTPGSRTSVTKYTVAGRMTA
jgi:hypothetical protein